MFYLEVKYIIRFVFVLNVKIGGFIINLCNYCLLVDNWFFFWNIVEKFN